MKQIVPEKRVRPLPAPAILLILHAKMPASTGYLVLYVLTLGLGDAPARTGARRNEDASVQVSQSRWVASLRLSLGCDTNPGTAVTAA